MSVPTSSDSPKADDKAQENADMAEALTEMCDEEGPYKPLRVWTMNEIRDHPMFMEDVPSDISDNPALLALQSAVFDGKTPQELAEHFKQLGNDAFKMKTKVAAQNAMMAYTRALEVNCEDKKLLAVIHSNRAAVSMRLDQHSKAVDDCRKAIELDPTNVKALFRAGKASEDLQLYGQAAGFCNEALRLAPSDNELRKLHARLKKQLALVDEDRRKKERITEEQEKRRKACGAAVEAVLKSRNLDLGNPLFDVSMYEQRGPAVPKLEGDALHWPIIFLYDEVGQSDFVEAFNEQNALEDILQMMFPEDRQVDWDEEGKYVWHRLTAYLEVHDVESKVDGTNTRMIKMSLDEPLDSLLVGYTVSCCLMMHVQVSGSPACKAWLAANFLPSE